MNRKDRKAEKKNFIARLLETGKIMARKSININVNREIKKRANY